MTPSVNQRRAGPAAHPQAPPGMSFVDGVRGRVHCRWWEPGSAPLSAVVLLHDRGERLADYEPLARALVPDRVVVWALDHAGHGLSDGPAPEPGDQAGLADLATDALALTGLVWMAYGLPLLLAGQGLGAEVALRVAGRDAVPPAGLVLAGPDRSSTVDATVPVLELPDTVLRDPEGPGAAAIRRLLTDH